MECRRPENHCQHETKNADEHQQDTRCTKRGVHSETVREAQGGHQSRNSIGDDQPGDDEQRAQLRGAPPTAGKGANALDRRAGAGIDGSRALKERQRAFGAISGPAT